MPQQLVASNAERVGRDARVAHHADREFAIADERRRRRVEHELLIAHRQPELFHAQEREVLLDLALALNIGGLVLDPEEIDGRAVERLELPKEVGQHAVTSGR